MKWKKTKAALTEPRNIFVEIEGGMKYGKYSSSIRFYPMEKMVNVFYRGYSEYPIDELKYKHHISAVIRKELKPSRLVTFTQDCGKSKGKFVYIVDIYFKEIDQQPSESQVELLKNLATNPVLKER